MRILIVEDDQVLADGLRRVLSQEGHIVTHETDGNRADELLTTYEYDLVILDIGLPGIDGIEILGRVRRRKNNLPVLLLTARDSVADRVIGLDQGADDYLAKPFDLYELKARIRALLRRGNSAQSSELKIGTLCFDINGQRVSINGAPIELVARELALLEILMSRTNRVVSKELLCAQLTHHGDEISPNAIEVYVHRLRKKIEASHVEIRTLRGLGYMIES